MTPLTPDQLVHPHEDILKAMLITLGIIVWLALAIMIPNILLVFLFALIPVSLLRFSVLMSRIKGHGVRLSPEQYPDLYQQYLTCCERLDVPATARVYILKNGEGPNVCAARFLRTFFIVLSSDTLDALEQHPDGVQFYLGYSLCFLKRKHFALQSFSRFVRWLPLLGPAYSRAREHTCDYFGTACCSSTENAARALAALAVGEKRWKSLNLKAYLAQNQETGGFWMSLNTVTSGSNWLSTRIALILGEERAIPSRHPLAYLVGAFVPFFGQKTITTALRLYTFFLIVILCAGALFIQQHNPALWHLLTLWAFPYFHQLSHIFAG